MKKVLIDKISKRTATIGVVGLGYVGLPLIRAIVTKGFSTIGFDINQKKVAGLLNGKSDITTVTESDLENIFKYNVEFTVNFEKLAQCDVVLVCVPTPLAKNRQPDLSHVTVAFETIARHLKKSALLVLESTTYPGTTEEIILPIIQKNTDSSLNFFIAYSPEREDPGNTNFSNIQIPKIVGGLNQDSVELAELFYSSFISKVHTVSSCKVAEAVKVFENSFRLINISFVNEMKIIFDAMNIDIWEVIEAAETKPFGFMPFYPGPGIGGHCIPIDSFYLSSKAHEYGLSTKFIEVCGEIIKLMPHYVVNKTAEAIDKYLLRGLYQSNILILGVSYKQNIGDFRASPSIDIWNILENRGANVEYYDPYVPTVEINGKFHHSVIFEKIDFFKYDAVVLLTSHNGIDYQKVLDNSKILIDTRNIVSNFSIPHDVKVIKA